MASSANHANSGNRKSRRWLWLLVALTLVASAGLGIHAALKPVSKIDPARIVQVEKGDIARSVVATGKIQPRAVVAVKSKASGIVKKIYVDYGEYVKQGQVLVELDKEELMARRREAHAMLVAAEAAVQAAEAAYERNQVEAQGTDIPFLKSAFERAQELHRQGLIARSAMEDAEKAYRLALNQQAAALRNLAVSRAEIARAKAQVAQARAGLDRVEEDLRNATVVSPMDGLVLSRDVEVGDAVSSILVLGSNATLIMQLGDVSDVYVLGKVDQADIGSVYLGQPARITVESFKNKKFEGRVTKISPLGVDKDNVTTFEVRVSIKNPSGELRANMSANAEIILEERKNVLLAPESAIIYDRNRSAYVETPDPGAEGGKRRIPVRIGISNGVKTQLISGVRAGDKLVLQ